MEHCEDIEDQLIGQEFKHISSRELCQPLIVGQERKFCTGSKPSRPLFFGYKYCSTWALSYLGPHTTTTVPLRLVLLKERRLGLVLSVHAVHC